MIQVKDTSPLRDFLLQCKYQVLHRGPQGSLMIPVASFFITAQRNIKSTTAYFLYFCVYS